MTKEVLIIVYIYSCIICRSFRTIISVVFILLVYASKNNTDYALKVQLYSLIKVDDLVLFK